MAGFVFVNPAAGRDDVDVDDLRQRFAPHEVRPTDPADLAAAVRDALTTSPTFVGVAGGDGTVREVAEQLAGGSTALLVVPAGTRNHFAHDLGIDSLDAAVAAAGDDARTDPVDIGDVNGRTFVNNSSIGLYPKIVVRREVHERRLRKGVATVVATFEQLRESRPVTAEIDGVRRRAWIVFVGNGRYGEGLLDLADRESLTTGTLDVRIVRADRPLARLRVVGALLLGRLARSPLLERLEVPAVTIDFDRASVEVALDGEIVRMEPPLRFRSVSQGLQVRVPPER